jgi:hypothetical protein
MGWQCEDAARTVGIGGIAARPASRIVATVLMA